MGGQNGPQADTDNQTTTSRSWCGRSGQESHDCKVNNNKDRPRLQFPTYQKNVYICWFIPTCLDHTIYLFSHQNSMLPKINFVSLQKRMFHFFSMIHTITCVSHHSHVITPKEYCSHQNRYCSHPNSEDSYHWLDGFTPEINLFTQK